MMKRHRSTTLQFIKFGLVGGSGTVVNFVAAVVATKIGLWVFDALPADPFINLLGTRFHIRWYHVFATAAFVVANTWNFQLNRWWTFKSGKFASWWREFVPFFVVGLLSLAFSLFVQTLLMNPTSPIALPDSIFDNSSGLRTKFYWANLISIFAAMPVNFLVNKFWTFKAVRQARGIEPTQ